jgi:hypothetical protein
MREASEGRRISLKVLIWGLATTAVVLLVLFFFDVTPAEIAYQVSRCLLCH